jgi:hypothetical protein
MLAKAVVPGTDKLLPFEDMDVLPRAAARRLYNHAILLTGPAHSDIPLEKMLEMERTLDGMVRRFGTGCV